MLMRKAADRSTESGMLPIRATRKKWITQIGIHVIMYTPMSKRTVLASLTWSREMKNEKGKLKTSFIKSLYLAFHCTVCYCCCCCRRFVAVFLTLISQQHGKMTALLKHRAIGRWVRPHPLTRRKGRLNLRGRIEMTVRMQ